MNNTETRALAARIMKDFGKAYQLNDEAHREPHFDLVDLTGNTINDRLDLRYDPKLILLVAYFHDMYSWSRFNHHLMSALWIETTDHPIIAELDDHERKMVAAGCREHRASGKDPFTSQFAELMCSADRELPGSVERMIERSVLSQMGKGYSREDALLPAIAHIKEKFGPTGYCRYPELYMNAFEDTLEEQRRQIAQL